MGSGTSPSVLAWPPWAFLLSLHMTLSLAPPQGLQDSGHNDPDFRDGQRKHAYLCLPAFQLASPRVQLTISPFTPDPLCTTL